jgi:hypothetical protein
MRRGRDSNPGRTRMQVVGLSGHMISSGELASRIAAKPQGNKPRSARRPSAVGGRRWLMGQPPNRAPRRPACRARLDRGEKQVRSKRPKRMRAKTPTLRRDGGGVASLPIAPGGPYRGRPERAARRVPPAARREIRRNDASVSSRARRRGPPRHISCRGESASEAGSPLPPLPLPP